MTEWIESSCAVPGCIVPGMGSAGAEECITPCPETVWTETAEVE